MYGANNIQANAATTSGSGEKAVTRQCPIEQCKFQENQESSNLTIYDHYLSSRHTFYLEHLINQKLPHEDDEDDQSIKNDSDSVDTETSLLIEQFEKANENLAQTHTLSYQMEPMISNIEKEMGNVTRSIKIQEGNIQGMGLNQTVLECQFRTVERKLQQVQSVGTCSMSDGTATWKISGVQEKVLDAQSERATSIYSPSFFTSSTGYKVCVRLYLNGDGTARGTHISVFLVILRGPYDRLLKWPFSYRVAFCLVDQRALLEPEQGGARDIVDCFRPNVQSTSFEEPITEMNIASGIPKFMPLSVFEEPMDRNRYRINDTIFLRTYIDFQDLNKSLIPFIFSLNPGLPSHVREQLILEESQKGQ